MRKLITALALLNIIFFCGCKESEDKTDKKFIGKWKTVEVDINITDEEEKAREGFEKLKEEFEQMVLKTKYEFGEDKSFKIISPMENLTGTWRYQKDINAVIISDEENGANDLDTFNIETSGENSFTLRSGMGADGSVLFKIEKEEANKSE